MTPPMPPAAADDAYWVHDLSPYIFELGSGWGLRWYGLAYVAGIVVAVWLAIRWYRQGRMPLDPKRLQDAAFWVGLGMIVGARLYYCLCYYDPNPFGEPDPPVAFFADPLYFFKLWEGGMASHGGAIGLAVGGLLYWWRLRRRFSLWVLIDAIAAVAPIGVIFGRLANFVNGELWGRPTAAAWGIKFPSATIDDLRLRHAHQLIDTEQLERLSAQAHLLRGALDRLGLHYSDDAGPNAAFLHALHRNFVAAHGLARHPSQLYAVVLEGIVVLAVGLTVHRLHRRPGLTAGAVLLAYGIGRFCDEFFRQPDAGYELFFGWMSKGQLYSLPLVVLGVGLLAWAARRPPRPELYAPPAAADEDAKRSGKT